MLNLMIYSFFMFIFSIMLLLFSLYMYMLKMNIFLEWIIYMINSSKFSYLMYLDYMSLMFLSVVMMISSMIFIYSIEYMSLDKTIKRFYYLVFLFIISMCLMILSPSILSILLGWDGLGLISYCLVIYYQNNISFNSGMMTIMCNRLGDIGLLMIICLCVYMGSWNSLLYSMSMFQMSMLMLAAMTKSAQLPFSLWLPAAMTAPTPVSSLVHSSTLVTAGVYLMIRYNNLFMLSNLNLFMLYISMMTMIMSGLMANFEYDLKKIIALSTLSQLGFMMMILSIGFYELAFFHLIIHALFKSLMFLCAGDFIHCMNNNQDIRNYCSMMNIFPIKSLIIMFSLLSLSGFPFLCGFYSKDLIIEVFFNYKLNNIFLLMFYLSTLLTVSYSFRLLIWLLMNLNYNFNSYIQFSENKIFSFCMIIMLILVIFSGYIFMNLIFNKFILLLMLLDKILILKFYIFGIYLGYLSFMINMKKIIKLVLFFNSMFFLSFMYKISYLKIFKFIYKYEIFIEKGWLEIFMGLYFYKLMYFINKYIYKKKMNMIVLMKFYFYMFFFMLILY